MINPNEFKINTINDILDKIHEGHNRITALIATGMGKNNIIAGLANKLVEESGKKVLIVFDKRMLLEQAKQAVCDNKKIQCCLMTDIQKKIADKFKYLILVDLLSASRNHYSGLFKEISNIIISFGSTWPYNTDIYSIQKGTVDYCLTFVTDNIIDIRDVAVANSEEKDSLKKQILLYDEELKKLEADTRANIDEGKKKLEGRMSYEESISNKILMIREIAISGNDEEDEVNKFNSEAIIAEYEKKFRVEMEARKKLEDELNQQNKVLEEMRLKEEFMQQLLMSMGISQNVIDIAFKKIELLRLTLNEELNNESDESRKEAIMKEFQDGVAEVVLEVTSGCITAINQERYENILIEALTKEVWNKLDSSSRLFLLTSKITYDNMTNLVGDLDYSGVCLLITKAVEVEVTKRFYKRYVDYLNIIYPITREINKWPKCALNREGNAILDSKGFTLGSVKFIVGIDNKGRVKNTYVNRIFHRYAKDELFKEGISDSQYSLKLTNNIEFVEKVRSDYRNPAAHRDKLTAVSARECLEYVIETQKKLKEMIIDFKF